jgi:hypothetical protein
MIEDPPSPEYQEQDAMLAAALSICPKRDKPAVTIGFRQGWEAHKVYIANHETIGPFDTAEQLIAALDGEPAASARLRETITARPLNGTLDDYWSAPSGEGPHAYTWSDKPHRLLYDLIGALLFYTGKGKR